MDGYLITIDPDDSRADVTLSDRELAFVEEYVSTGMNASRAYRTLHPGLTPRSAGELGYKMRNRPRVSAAIDARVNQMAMKTNEIIAGIAETARASIADCFEYNPETRSIVFQPQKAFETGAIHHMRKLQRNQDGTIVVQMNDKFGALMALARMAGLLSEAEGDGEAVPAEVHVYVPKNTRDK